MIRLRRRRRSRPRMALLVWRRPRGKSLGRDHQRIGGDPREGDGGRAGRRGGTLVGEVDALVLRRRRQDQPAAGFAVAAVFPGKRLRLSSVSNERGRANYNFI